MANLIADPEPQKERNPPEAETEIPAFEWVYRVPLPEAEEPDPVEVVDEPTPVEVIDMRQAPVPYLHQAIEASQVRPRILETRYVEPTLEFIPWVWRVTATIVKISIPLMLGAGVLYGLFLGIVWLVSQTIFWVVLALAALLFLGLSFILENIMDRKGTELPQSRTPPRGDVVTNVHVTGGQGNVHTNIFVNFQDHE